MKNIIIIIGLIAAFECSAHANPSIVNIENADKVIVKTGISDEKVSKKLKLLWLKKLKNTKATLDEKISTIKEKCAEHNLSDEDCQKLQRKLAKKLHNCFLVKKEFMQKHFKSDKTE